MFTLNAPIKPDIRDLDVHFYEKGIRGDCDNITNLFGEIIIYHFLIGDQDVACFPELAPYLGRKLYVIDSNKLIKVRISEMEPWKE